MRQTRSLRIMAPPERVWALIDDERKLPLWMPNVVSTRFPDGKPAGNPIGARFIQEMRVGDTLSSYEGEVTEYQPGKLLGVIMLPEAFAIHVVYHVEGDEDWTRLDYGCDMQPKTWKGRLMMYLGRKLMASILDQQLARLKLVAETGKPAV